MCSCLSPWLAEKTKMLSVCLWKGDNEDSEITQAYSREWWYQVQRWIESLVTDILPAGGGTPEQLWLRPTAIQLKSIRLRPVVHIVDRRCCRPIDHTRLTHCSSDIYGYHRRTHVDRNHAVQSTAAACTWCCIVHSVKSRGQISKRTRAATWPSTVTRQYAENGSFSRVA